MWFQTHRIPGQACLQDSGVEKAEQLGEVYMRTSLSSRLLKPPNTYMTLEHKNREKMLEDHDSQRLPRLQPPPHRSKPNKRTLSVCVDSGRGQWPLLQD